jgi:hypothetical protein
MTSILVDEVYESMDPISQMLEPFQSDIFDIIRSLPDLVEITEELALAKLIEQCKERQSYVSVYDFLIDHLNIDLTANMHNWVMYILKETFTPSVEDSFTFDPDNDRHVGSVPKISFTKDTKKLSDDNIVKLILERITTKAKVNISADSSDIMRIRELAQLLEIDASQIKSKSFTRLQESIFNKVYSNIMERKWRIRSQKAIEDLFAHINCILEGEKGWEESRIALIHLKMMVRFNKPIYKITEL